MFEFVFYRHGRRNDFRQLFGAGHRFNAVTLDNGASNAFAKAFFAKGFNHPGNIRFICRLQPLGG
ncbi:hypothetical protein D3C81_2229700 [compost metagenome]